MSMLTKLWSIGAAFPPARIVVVGRDLLEAELLVVIRADPFGGVDGALLQRRIDFTAGDLLRHDAELGHHGAGKAADAHLETLQIGDCLDLLAEPAAHLAPVLPPANAKMLNFL